MKGHESRLYEALWVIVGPFFEFTVVKLKRPNKHLELENTYYLPVCYLLLIQQYTVNTTYNNWQNCVITILNKATVCNNFLIMMVTRGLNLGIQLA